MPKNRERSASKVASGTKVKPYDRTRAKSSTPAMPSSAAPLANGHANGVAVAGPSKLAAEAKPDVTAPAKNGPSRRRSKKRKSNRGAEDVDMRPATVVESENENAADVEVEVEAEIVSRTASPEPAAAPKKPKLETAADIINRHRSGLPPANNAVQEALKSEKAEHGETRRLLRDTQSQLRVSEEKAAKTEKELSKRVEQLEKELEERKKELVAQSAQLANQTQMITDQTKHHDNIKDGLSCGVCFEIFEDPHLLSCGHTACRKCLVQWFRSSNAYRGEDIDAVIEGMDLTYRTKICHMCREPVLRRPVRMFALKAVIETLGLAPHREDEERNEDHWALTFPPDPTSYLIKDESDAVNRCPACGCEVVGGVCEGCNAEFSDDDFEGSIHDLDEMDDDGEVWDSDGGDGEDYPDDAELAEFMDDVERYHDVMDMANAQLRALNGLPPNAPRPQRAREVPPPPNFIDDIADHSDDGYDSLSEDDPYGDDEGNFWGDRADDNDVYDDHDHHHDHHHHHHHEHEDWSDEDHDHAPPDPRDILRYGADAFPISDSDDDVVAAPRGGRRRDPAAHRSDSEDSLVTPQRRGRLAARARAPAQVVEDEDEEDEEDDSYEDSFIDDDESVQVIEDSEAEVDAAAGDDVESDAAPDEPTVDELRQRRAARFAARRDPSPPAREPTPPRRVAARRQRRVISVSSDSE